MQREELLELIARVQTHQCEMQIIETKSAHEGAPTRLYDTLSSFSNQDDGGVILFGLDERQNFKAVGVYDAQDLQHRIAEQCKQMEPAVRPLFSIAAIDGKTVVSAEIPGIDITKRPVFYKGVGRIKGAFVRVGDADEQMSEYEIYSYEAFRKRIYDDLREVSAASIEMFNMARVKEYITHVKKNRKNLTSHVSDHEMMELMGITRNGVPTLAGVLMFSIYPQGYFPQLCITAVSIPGLEMGELGDDGERFIDNQRITGLIPEMLNDAVDFVRRNSRVKTIIDNNGKRTDKPEYPIKAVREAIINALVHRDYSIHSESVPVRIEMYRDRMEIKNGGGLYGKITIDSLGKVRPETRNAALANMLEILKVTENRYSGIPTIRKEFENAGMVAPLFTVRSGEFIVIFTNNIYKSKDTASLRNTTNILEFCEIPRTRDEICQFIGKTQYYTVKTIITPLVKSGKLKMTMPDKPKSKNQKYVRA